MDTHNQPLVSIVLPTLNGARYLPEALASCLEQTYKQLELIVVDGGSTDATLDIIAAYTDARIRLIRQRDNAGKLPGALNLGLAAARGAYLTWMQDDSVYAPRAIATMVHELEQNPEVGQVYVDFWEIDASGRKIGIQRLPEPSDFLTFPSDPAGVCFLIRRSVRAAVGPHDVSSFPIQDADYRWRIARQFRSLHIRQPLYGWRVRPDSLTGMNPWIVQVRMGVSVRRSLGLLTSRQARRELGRFNVAYAFERYKSGVLVDVPGLIWSGLWRDPRFALNRGVWSILFRSLQGLLTGTGAHHHA